MFRTFNALALATALMLAAPASAFTPEEAQALTREITAEVQSEVSAEGQEDAVFIDLMNRYADLDAIARYALGAPWRTASAAQQSAFIEAFSFYIAGKYGSQFSDYEGSEIEVLAARDLGRRGIVVDSRITVPSGNPVLVEWQFSDRSGRPLLIDIVAEGVSLLASERAAIGRMLDQRGGDLDQLIAELPESG